MSYSSKSDALAERAMGSPRVRSRVGNTVWGPSFSAPMQVATECQISIRPEEPPRLYPTARLVVHRSVAGTLRLVDVVGDVGEDVLVDVVSALLEACESESMSGKLRVEKTW